MTKTRPTPSDRDGDVFGATRGEARWRRLAGAGLTTLLMVTALSWWVPLIPLVACGAIYVAGIPASLLLERRWPVPEGRSPVLRYTALGAVVGIGLAVGLAGGGTPTGPLSGWALLFAVVTVPGGALAGATTAWGARALPGRWVGRVALGGPIVAGAITLAAVLVQGT